MLLDDMDVTNDYVTEPQHFAKVLIMMEHFLEIQVSRFVACELFNQHFGLQLMETTKSFP